MKSGTFWKLVFVSVLMIAFNNCQPVGESGDGQATGGSGSSSGILDDSAKLVMSREFYDNTMLSQFEARCTSCHADPRDGGVASKGAVFDFDRIRDNLIQGESAIANDLINRLVDPAVHDPSPDMGNPIINNLCPDGSAEGLCYDIVLWWNVTIHGDENATSPFLPGAGPGGGGGGGALSQGTMAEVSLLGRVSGFARNPDDAAEEVDVLIYVGGDASTGTLIATVTADERGPGGSQSGHYFSYQLPSEYLNGNSVTVYAYSMTDDPENLLEAAPKTARAWEINEDAESFWASNIEPELSQRCSRCHTNHTYEGRFFALSSPLPGEGGSSSNNLIYNKVSGQTGHSGGTFCSGSSLCSNLQNAWNLQFQ
ncbi:MAG: hypothetical protein CL677_03835 [Bdellovibrionaceae bacterium]|nr:hypothetical protein [Pseudobdellovibrionaceae bacterium]